MRITIILAIFLVFLLTECSPESSLINQGTPRIHKEKITLHSIRIDTIEFEANHSSYVGNLAMEDSIFFFSDRIFGRVYLHDLTGKYLEHKLGVGNGPGEIFSLFAFLPLDTCFVVVGSSNELYKIDSNWRCGSKKVINWQQFKSYKQLLKQPEPDDNGIYELVYDKLIIGWLTEDQILLPIMTTHPDLNGYFKNCKEYYTKCSIIGEFNITTGKLEKKIGRRSDVYQHYKNIPNFDFINFDLADSILYVTYEPDSLIYVFHYPDSLLYVFGYEGQNMNTDYAETKNADAAFDSFNQHRNTYGFYTGIKIFPEKELVFRTYQKGKHSNTDGLQIYKSNILIGDVDVPKGFKVIGYQNGFYYANLEIDEYNEKIFVGKFNVE